MSKLIIVDDEPIFLDYIRNSILTLFPDIEVCGCFYNAKDALNFLDHNPIDIVLTDICMPEMDGLELSKIINQKFPLCVTIIISAYSEFDYAKSALRYNVTNYLLKPLDWDELKTSIEEALTLSITRNATLKNKTNLIDEQREVFFTDLLSGMFFSYDSLKSAFDKLNFPFSLSHSHGYLLKITVNPTFVAQNWHYDIDSFIIILKNALSLPSNDYNIYFIRKSANYHFIAFGETPFKKELIASFQNNIYELIHSQCDIVVYRHFDSLKNFLVQNESQHPSLTTPEYNDTRIEQALKYIENNYKKNLGRDEVAQAIYLSPSHFGYQFKKATGYSFLDYLNRLRITKAKELLATNMKINDISIAVGYQNPERFRLNFRQYTTLTPSEYRKKVLLLQENNYENIN